MAVQIIKRALNFGATPKDNGMVPTSLYIQALNEMFDD